MVQIYIKYKDNNYHLLDIDEKEVINFSWNVYIFSVWIFND